MGNTRDTGFLRNIIAYDASGNVGIGGAVNASYKVTINGTSIHTGASVFSAFVGINGSPGTAFPLEAYINSSTAHTSTSRGNVMRVYNSNTGANIFAGIELGGAGTANDGLAGINGIVTGSGSAALSFYTRNGGTFAERVRIEANGNVGIGGGANERLTITGSNGLAGMVRWTDATTGSAFLGFTSGGTAYIHSNNSSLAFGANGSNNFAETMRIANGNLGIGTSSPGYPLIVSRTLSSGTSLFCMDNATNTANDFGMDFTVLGYLRVGSIRMAYPSDNNLSMAFYTYNGAGNVTERMRIANGGNVGIGMTNPADLLSVAANQPSMSLRYQSAGTTSNPVISSFNFRDYDVNGGQIRGAIQLHDYSQNTSGTSMLFRVMNNSNTIITLASFSRDGGVYNYNNSTTWSQQSDIRIKQNFRPITGALDKMLSLNPTHFEYKANPSKTKTGFIAQEFEQVFAGHVSELEPTGEYRQYFKEGELMKSIDADLIPYLVKGLQEEDAKVEDLKVQVAELQTRIAYLENK